jgi:acyl-CoA thioester hydrolase
MNIRYLAPARLDDDVLIETQLEELGAASVRLVQAAFRQTGVEKGPLLAQASVRVGFVAPDGRPRRQPAPWRAAFADFLVQNSLAGNTPASSVSSPNQPGIS